MPVTVSEIESQSIDAMSFVPSQKEIEDLCKASIKALNDINNNIRSPMLSKLYHLPGKIGLCPDDLNPNHTVLAGKGAGRKVDGSAWKAGEGGEIGDNNIMTVINDRNMPFGGGSNGPNIVVTDCQEKYGRNRVNLFHQNRVDTIQMAKDVIQFRNKHLSSIFKLFVVHMCSRDFMIDFKLDPTKDTVLEESLRTDYVNMCCLFRKVLECISTYTSSLTIGRLNQLIDNGIIKSKRFPYTFTLNECGFECVSFCQTWLRFGSEVGEAQFSVMSPHFQTRFFITDKEKLKTIAGVTEMEIYSYIKIIQHFDEIMGKDYGKSGGGQAFINVDKLCDLYT
jgi:hypothetical protein